MDLTDVSDLDEGPMAVGYFFPMYIVRTGSHSENGSADCCLSSTQMQRLRQWEAQLLQEIEEAVHHELTIQEGIPSTEFPTQGQGPLSIGPIRVDAQDPSALV